MDQPEKKCKVCGGKLDPRNKSGFCQYHRSHHTDKERAMSRRYIKSWRTEMKKGEKTPRVCLKCGKTFKSVQPVSQNRICNECKKKRDHWNIPKQHSLVADDYTPNYYLAMGQARWYDT